MLINFFLNADSQFKKLLAKSGLASRLERVLDVAHDLREKGHLLRIAGSEAEPWYNSPHKSIAHNPLKLSSIDLAKISETLGLVPNETPEKDLISRVAKIVNAYNQNITTEVSPKGKMAELEAFLNPKGPTESPKI